MNRNFNLPFFHSLGCKPMKDVILHTPNEIIHCANSMMERLEQMQTVKDISEAEMKYHREYLIIEAIPEKLRDDEITNDRADMIDGYKESFPGCFGYDRNQL